MITLHEVFRHLEKMNAEVFAKFFREVISPFFRG